jgi:hypothetical protein
MPTSILPSKDLLAAPDAETAASVNRQLDVDRQRLDPAHQGLVAEQPSSFRPACSPRAPVRGRRHLAEALEGKIEADISAERCRECLREGPAKQLLEIYLPIGTGAELVGAYEIYQDATDLEGPSTTRRRCSSSSADRPHPVGRPVPRLPRRTGWSRS